MILVAHGLNFCALSANNCLRKIFHIVFKRYLLLMVSTLVHFWRTIVEEGFSTQFANVFIAHGINSCALLKSHFFTRSSTQVSNVEGDRPDETGAEGEDGEAENTLPVFYSSKLLTGLFHLKSCKT